MSSAKVIDALFERTVDIVQSLPSAGPIQTSYEEKLALYGLFKQATEGDVRTRRPGMFDMLGRAKWDAWDRHKGYSEQDAKQLYVESMLKILRRFEDRPLAISLMAELEAYSGDVAEQVMNGTLAETSSIHSSSIGKEAPSRTYEHSAMYDEASSSIADDVLVPAPPPLPRPRTTEAETNTGSGSHDTVTGSDMPPRPLTLPKERAQETATSLQRTSSQRRAMRAARPRPSRREESVYSGVAAASDRGSRSFASAMESTAPSRSIQGGPLGRYASSVGSRSSVHGGAKRASSAMVARAAPPAGPPTSSAPAAPASDMDQTLRAIQASLAALTERLERAESSMTPQKQGREVRVVLQQTMQAARHALQDMALFLGLGSSQGDTTSLSYEAWRARGTRRGTLWSLLRSPFRFAMIMASLAFRILLDMTSVVVLASLAVAALRRLSGRGDPWIALRLLGRLGGRLDFLTNAAGRRTALRALLASAVVGGVAMETSRNVSL